MHVVMRVLTHSPSLLSPRPSTCLSHQSNRLRWRRPKAFKPQSTRPTRTNESPTPPSRPTHSGGSERPRRCCLFAFDDLKPASTPPQFNSCGRCVHVGPRVCCGKACLASTTTTHPNHHHVTKQRARGEGSRSHEREGRGDRNAPRAQDCDCNPRLPFLLLLAVGGPSCGPYHAFNHKRPPGQPQGPTDPLLLPRLTPFPLLPFDRTPPPAPVKQSVHPNRMDAAWLKAAA